MFDGRFGLVSIPAAAAEIGFLLLATALILYFRTGFILLTLRFGGWVEAEQCVEENEESFDHHGFDCFINEITGQKSGPAGGYTILL